MYDYIKDDIAAGNCLLETGDWQGQGEHPPLLKDKYASERRRAKVGHGGRRDEKKGEANGGQAHGGQAHAAWEAAASCTCCSLLLSLIVCLSKLDLLCSPLCFVAW